METLEKVAVGEESIHLFHSVRDKVMEICEKEGATLNEFVNVAVAEKLAHYAQMEWLKRRLPPNEENIAQARRILIRAGSNVPDPGDELPEGYVFPPEM